MTRLQACNHTAIAAAIARRLPPGTVIDTGQYVGTAAEFRERDCSAISDPNELVSAEAAAMVLAERASVEAAAARLSGPSPVLVGIGATLAGVGAAWAIWGR